ncbi:hypothetical protein [Ensifer canadensis]
MRKSRRDDREAPDLGAAFVSLACAAAMNGLGRPERAREWAQKAVTNPAQTTVPGWAAELVGGPTASFLLSLASGIRAMPLIMARAHGIPLSFNARAISLDVSAVAGFIGEGQPIGVSKASLRGSGMLPASVKAMVTFSEELGDYSTPLVEEVMRQILGDAVGEAVEEVFFSADVQTAYSPAGILVGTTSVTPGASFAEDVRGLVAALGAPADPIFVVSPARRAGIAASGTLASFDYPLLSSSAVADDRMVALDADALVFGAASPGFKIGKEATLIEQDSAVPTDLLSGSPIRSLWQTNMASMRISLPISWVMPRTAAYVDGVAW